MSLIKIKMCGIRSPETAEFCARLGADFIGMIFCPTSPRYLTAACALEISQAARENLATPVAVFTDQTPEEITALCEHAKIDHVQLHGQSRQSQLIDLPRHLHFFYLNPQPEITLLNKHRDYIIYDSQTGGSGIALDWTQLNPSRSHPFFIAGGLNVDNVQTAINTLNPHGVDVCSGIESSRGIKSHSKIEAFISKVKYA